MKTVEQSPAAGIQLLLQQIAGLKTQIASASGLSAEDKAALVQGATDLEDTTTKLGAAIPANVPPPAA